VQYIGKAKHDLAGQNDINGGTRETVVNEFTVIPTGVS
jgi:hypothetical protein